MLLSCCLFLNETDRRQDGASSIEELSAAGSVASGDGARPLGGLPSEILGIISGAVGGLSVNTPVLQYHVNNLYIY